MLILEGAQAGLSWITILRKRAGVPAGVRSLRSEEDRALRRGEEPRAARAIAGIVRNRLKIDGAVKNARAFLAVQKEFGSFDAYIWQFVGGTPKVNRPRSHEGRARRRRRSPTR